MEVVKGVIAPPTPSTEAWWRAAVREAVYALRHRRLVQYLGEVVSWAGLLKKMVFISSSGLTHLARLQSKPSLLHASVYFLNRLWSIGAVFFT